MEQLVYSYRKSYDHTIEAWTKRSDANDFAVFLAAELKINAKGVQVLKDGKTHRVYVPLAVTYWQPKNGEAAWMAELERLKESIRAALQA